MGALGKVLGARERLGLAKGLVRAAFLRLLRVDRWGALGRIVGVRGTGVWLQVAG